MEHLAQLTQAIESHLAANGSTDEAIRLLEEALASQGETEEVALKRGETVLAIVPLPRQDRGLWQYLASSLYDRRHRQARKEEELARLRRSGSLLAARLGVEPTLRVILEMALELTGARYGIFRLLNAEGTHLVTAAIAGEQLDRPLVEALPLTGRHVCGWVARHRRSVCIKDLHKPPWSSLYFPLDQLLEMRSELAAPLLGTGDRFEGVINLESPELAAFSRSHQLLLETFAAQAVVAIQQARLLDALQEIAERLLDWPMGRVLHRLVELVLVLVNARGVVLRYPGGTIQNGQTRGERIKVALEQEGHLVAFLDSPGEWERKVLACLAHHADLALKNERRLEELRASQQRQAVAETFAAVGDLAANLLHQLNNKMGVIPVRVEGILDKCSSAVDQSPYLARNLKEIEGNAQRALTIVRENLGILRPRPQGPVRLSQCVARAREELKLSLSVEVALEVPPVRGDFRSITLIFLNLLENAAQALQGEGQVTITGECLRERVVVTLRDDGPGIPHNRHEEIFELSPDRSRPHNLGFGLWWVKTMMERMGGSIDLESDGASYTQFRLEFCQA